MKRLSVLFSILLAPFAVVPLAQADDGIGEYGGYVSDEEDRFVDYVFDFVDEFAKDCTGLFDVCSDYVDSWINTSYTRKHYTFSGCSHLLNNSINWVDSVDLAYVAGHGRKSNINMSGTDCNLENASWGRFSTKGNGDLESIVFHSCKVLEMDAGYRSRWMRSSANQARPFSGLHHAMGFRTNHVNGAGAGAWTSDELAENLEEGQKMRTAWYDAVEDGYWLSPFAVFIDGDNKQAVFYLEANGNETMSQLYNGGAGDFNYGHANYKLDTYYRK